MQFAYPPNVAQAFIHWFAESFDGIAEWIDASQLALVICVLAATLASAHRLVRLARGAHVPARFHRAMLVFSSVPTRDHARRRLAASAAIRAAMGVGTILPTLARIAPLWGAIDFVITLADSSWSHGHDASSQEALLAWATSVSLRHLAFGIALAIIATSAHAAFVASACRVTGSRLGHPVPNAAVRTTLADRLGGTVLHWSVTSFVGAMATVMIICFVTAEFYPTYALNVDTGACANGGLMLRATSDHHVHRIDSRGIVVETVRSIDAARLVREQEAAVALQVQDGVRYGEIVAVVDALRGSPFCETVCVVVDAEVGSDP